MKHCNYHQEAVDLRSQLYPVDGKTENRVANIKDLHNPSRIRFCCGVESVAIFEKLVIICGLANARGGLHTSDVEKTHVRSVVDVDPGTLTTVYSYQHGRK
ncbi:unnamed protein product [Dibothriocephalus latus]|uniref:Uncharacterized protein n=1 Tax=Dibothriocephalus latus TaxID=60516 RepID=A0A3P7NQE8_DIBLA|nr:unnamed protein product [Dibothriocephalus latus]